MLVFPQTKDIFRTASLIVSAVVTLRIVSFAAVGVVGRTLRTLITAFKWDREFKSPMNSSNDYKDGVILFALYLKTR